MTTDRLGRAFGPGTLKPERRGNGPVRWVLRWTDANGTRRRRALSTDKRVAERIRADIITKRDLHAAGLGAVEGQSMPLQELVDAYLTDLKTRASPAFHYNVTGSLKRTLSSIGVKRVRDLRPIMLLQFRTKLAAQLGLSNTTANQQVDRLRAALNWGVKVGLIAENPIAHVARLPEGESHRVRVRRAMSDNEIERFLAAAVDDDREQAAYLAAETTIENGTRGPGYAARPRRERIPQAALWRAFVETGARYFELVSTTWADVDFEAGTMRLRATTTKSGKMRLVPLLDGLIDELRALREVHQRVLGRDGDRVFVTPTGAAWPKPSVNAMRLFARLCSKAGIARVDAHGERLDIHALRHTAASRYARLGVAQSVTQRVLGHSDGRITNAIYTHLGTEDLRDALEAAVSARPRPRLVREQSRAASEASA